VWLGCGSVDAASSHFLESLYLAATLIGIEPLERRIPMNDVIAALFGFVMGIYACLFVPQALPKGLGIYAVCVNIYALCETSGLKPRLGPLEEALGE
jgi:hypothetical protein